MSDSMRPHRRQPTGLCRPWDSPGKNTGVGCHFLLQCMKVKSEREVTQSCLTLSNPMDCSPPGSSIHGIFQARILEWVAIAFSYFFFFHIRWLNNTWRKTWIKNQHQGTCLAVQWLRLCTSNEGGRVQSLVRNLKSTCHGAKKLKKKKRISTKTTSAVKHAENHHHYNHTTPYTSPIRQKSGHF